MAEIRADFGMIVLATQEFLLSGDGRHRSYEIPSAVARQR